MRHRLAVLALVLLPCAAPAEQVTHGWAPRTAEEAQALRLGLALWSLRSGLQNGGTVRQWGRDNLAALSQGGTGNWGAVVQRGDGHSAVLSQSGDGNAHMILQAGRGAQAEVAQEGGELGVTVQIGW